MSRRVLHLRPESLWRWGPVVLAAALGVAACGGAGQTSTTSTPPPTTATTTTTTTTTTTPPSSTSTPPPSSTTTTTAAVTECSNSSLSVAHNGAEAAAGTVAVGFGITNDGSLTCELTGYPALTLVPAQGSVSPIFSHNGQGSAFRKAPGTVLLPTGGSAGFVMEYSDVQANGQSSCPEIVAVEVRLPGSGSTSRTVPGRFLPCGAPNISVSPVITASAESAQFD